MNTALVGIDPHSKTPGVAILYPNNVWQVCDTRAGAVTALMILQDYDEVDVLIEDVRFVSPGVKSKVALSRDIGFWEGICYLYGYNHELIHPTKWQTHFGLQRCTANRVKKDVCTEEQSYSDYKQYILDFALAHLRIDLTLETCDAALICEYLKQTQ